MKKLLLIIVIIFCVLAALVILAFLSLVFLVPWILMGGLLPDPPRPEITYGEFPFKLVYELNGKRITVNDTLICEYNGVSWNEGMGKHREWKSYLYSNTEQSDILLLELEDGTKIYYSTDSPDYYMGDGNKTIFTNEPFNGVFADGPSRSSLHAMDIEDLLEYLNIVFIEWEIAPPVENEFV